MLRSQAKGSALLPVIAIVGVILIAGLVLWAMSSRDKKKNDIISINDGSSSTLSNEKSSSNADVTWSWGGDKWLASSQPVPDCGAGPEFKTPVEISKATAVLYPGETRGGNYKAHGGFLFANSKQSDIEVTIPIDSHLIKASRYIELGEIQYFLVFSVPCGFAYRFDHLLTLTPEFQAIADSLPKPEVNNSETTNIQPAKAFKAGTKVATAVGFKTNTSMDFGVYDVRQPNASSKQSDYAAQRAQFKEFDYYGVCFMDYFNKSVSAQLRALPGADGLAGKKSDYCK